MSASDGWKLRFRTPSILSAQVAARARTRGLVAHNKSGTFQYYAWNVADNQLNQITNRPEGAGFPAFISPDGRHIYYLEDKQGNEIGHYARIPFEGGKPEDITPELPPYSSLAGGPSFSISRNGNVIGFTSDSADGFHLYCINVAADGRLSQPRRLMSNKNLAVGPHLSADGRIAIWASSERSDRPQFSLVAVDTSSGEQLSELWDGPGSSMDYESVAVSPIAGDQRIVTATNRTGIERLVMWNLTSGERLELQVGGLEGSMRAFDWSPDGSRILFRTYNKAIQQLYTYDMNRQTIDKLNHPPGTNSAPYFWTDHEIWTHWQDFTHPQCLISLDAENGVQKRVVLSAGQPPAGHGLRSFTITSLDGQEVQGWFGVPDGIGPFPTVIETHGGPETVVSSTYMPESEAWMDHGFAYVSINYRGSATFGKPFIEKIWGDLGHWEVEDMVAARAWLVDHNVARPDEVLLTGWSYGGYLTLQAMGKRPELWAGGMAGIAIADWRMLYEDASDAMKAWVVSLLGGTPLEAPEEYAACSPITYVESIRAPILIMQGRNDSRTPARPVQIYAERMRKLGKPIEVHWFDAGHLGAYVQTDMRIQLQEQMLAFARASLSSHSK